MRAAVAFAVLLALASSIAVAAGGPVAAETVDERAESIGGGTHGNHLSVDPQLSGDGSVVVETLSVLSPSFVVLFDESDESLGHAAVEETGFQTDLRVDVDGAAWESWTGNRTLRAVLHADTNGNGEYDPGVDQSLVRNDLGATTQFALAKADGGNARVLASEFTSRPVGHGAVTLRRVELAEDGFVVVRSRGDDSESIGARGLDAGAHEDVTVDLDEAVLDEQDYQFAVDVVLYRDDGDGEFGDGDEPVTAGGEQVGTYLSVVKSEPENGSDADGNGGDDENGGDGDIVINTATPAPGETATPSGGDGPAGGETATDATGDGFGPVVAALGALLAWFVVHWRRSG